MTGIGFARTSALLPALLLCACAIPAANYVDASAEPRFAQYVCTSRTTSTEMLLFGTDSYPSEKKIQSYRLMPRPGVAGRHVLSQSLLPPGVVVNITGARRCTNCTATGPSRAGP